MSNRPSPARALAGFLHFTVNLVLQATLAEPFLAGLGAPLANPNCFRLVRFLKILKRVRVIANIFLEPGKPREAQEASGSVRESVRKTQEVPGGFRKRGHAPGGP